MGRAAFAFSQRRGGVSTGPYASLNLGFHVGDVEAAVAENRRRVLAALGLADSRLVEAEQVHGGEVAVIDEEWLRRHQGPRSIAPGVDALVTRESDVALSLHFADCVPVFLTDREGQAIALAHAGWRGTAACAAANAVEMMARHCGVTPRDLQAVIGPCVGPCCYEVGEEVAQAVLASLAQPDRAGPMRGSDTRGQWFLDLAAINAQQLVAVGVPGEAIAVSGRCTCCEREVFFSVRGDGPITGRCGAFAYLAPS